jgi:hypothetical protein
MVTQEQRNDGKLDRLLERNEKILREIMKSKTTNLQKAESYKVFVEFINGICYRLEEKYPYLREEITSNKKGEPRWAKTNTPE